MHLTRLADFSALNAGRPRIEMTPEARRRGDHAAGFANLCGPAPFEWRAGCRRAGRYRWALIVDAPGLADRHDLGVVTVFADETAAMPTPRSDPMTTRRRSAT